MTRVLRTVLRETLALFVDDGPFAGAIVVWVVAVGLLAREGLVSPEWGGPVLFVGLVALLVGSGVRRARR